MPGKSQHGRGKHPHHQSKKSKAKQRLSTLASPPTVASEIAQTAPTVSVSPPPKATTSPVQIIDVQYPYIISELKKIGIIAGIILIILIVLAVVLS